MSGARRVEKTSMRKEKAIQYLQLARHFADIFSKDRSTKVGALFLEPKDCTILAAGYNGFPRGCKDNIEERHQRPLKYEYTEHAERNGIFNSVRGVLKKSVVVTTEELTMSSARALISVGATHVWSRKPVLPTDQHLRALALLREVDVLSGYHDGTSMRAEKTDGRILALEQHLRDAREYAVEHAKDPRPGATFFLPEDIEGKPLSKACSGFPPGADDARIERYMSEHRDFWVEDSVRNAIYKLARKSLEGSDAAVTEEPCSDCMRGIVAAGCKQIIAPTPLPEFEERWAEHFAASRAMAKELGIPIVSIPREEVYQILRTV